MGFFIVNRSLWEKKIVVTFHWSRQVEIGNENFNPRDGILGALIGVCLRISHIGGLNNAHILFFDIYEVGRIDIFGAGRIRPVFSMEVLDTNYWRHGYRFRFVVVRMDWKRSCRGGRVTKRQMFFVSDGADRYFVSSPWSEALRLLLGKIFWNRVLDVIKRCAEFWQNQVWRRFVDSEIFWMGKCWQNL